MKIYTKTGDSGETSLYGGDRVRKDSARIEAGGAVDECNCALGLAVSHLEDAEVATVISRIQGELWVLGGDISTPLELGDVVPRILPRHIEALECEIDRFETELLPLRNFILPGGCPVGAALHLARAVCRRAERSVVRLMESEAINPEIESYLNRLSDHLFVLARLANANAGITEGVMQRSQTAQ